MLVVLVTNNNQISLLSPWLHIRIKSLALVVFFLGVLSRLKNIYIGNGGSNCQFIENRLPDSLVINLLAYLKRKSYKCCSPLFSYESMTFSYIC
jgi:hypothetical protein